MYRISKIALRNFKFFYGETVIDFERKNVLIYGENGSGKSSIYWAIYTFLQSVFKDIPEIKKYFEQKHHDNLINRFGFQENNSSIKLTLENEAGQSEEREISEGNITSTLDNFIKELTLASDFINHHTLSRIYAYYHKDEINLFDIFDYELMEFISFKNALIEDGAPADSAKVNAAVWWKYISVYIPKLKDVKLIESYLADFNDNFQTYLNTITESTNFYITDRFKEKYNILFTYRPASYPLPSEGHELENDLKVKPPEIVLTVKMLTDKIEEDLRIIDSPQSFLNEARLSTIGLALRLAIIDEKYVEAYPKILVLDDFLMSMDMSNREHILNIILENYLKDYQIVFLTHQRGLFEDARKYIESYHAELSRKSGEINRDLISNEWKKHWKIFEMYETENFNEIPIPMILPYETHLQKAYKYFKETIDYNACGNNLRISLEEFFRNFLPHRYFVSGDGNPIPATSMMLDALLVKAREYFNYVGFDINPIDKLDRYRVRSLNPTAHYNPQTDYFKKEIQEIFSILDSLKKNRSEPLLDKNAILKFEIATTEGAIFRYEANLLDDIILYQKNDGSPSFFVDGDERGYLMISCTQDALPSRALNHEIRKCTLQTLYDETIEFINGHNHSIALADMYTVFTNENGTALENLKKY